MIADLLGHSRGHHTALGVARENDLIQILPPNCEVEPDQHAERRARRGERIE
jgi:hypothetical protein